MPKPSGWTKPLIETLDAATAAPSPEPSNDFFPPLYPNLPEEPDERGKLFEKKLLALYSDEAQRHGLHPWEAGICLVNVFASAYARHLFFRGHSADCPCGKKLMDEVTDLIQKLLQDFAKDPKMCLLQEIATVIDSTKKEKN